jgi:glycosyltransferase involved in cell wall biosynthesis
VIIPAYNQAKYLEDALQSVFAQTFTHYEIVVVNDGSTDGTAAVAARYADRIRYFFQENRGLAGARNTGIHQAQGELVALLDSDDIWLPDYLQTMVTLATAYPQTAVFFSAARCMDAAGQELRQIIGYQHTKPSALYNSMLRSNFIIPSTVTARKCVLREAGYFDQSLRSCEDWELWLRLISAGHEFIGVPAVLARYRIHGSSLSRNVAKMQSSYQAVVEKHFGLDDGQYDQWSAQKRIAYGGLYRYQLLTNIQRQNNWQCEQILQKAIMADPETSEDLSFYYELALGAQPVGQRGTNAQLTLKENGQKLETLLSNLFQAAVQPAPGLSRRRIYGMAYQALGLAAYNTGQLALCRSYLRKAVWNQPGLLRKKRIMGNYFISFLGNPGLNALRRFRKRFKRF